jgi:hypothetical protein
MNTKFNAQTIHNPEFDGGTGRFAGVGCALGTGRGEYKSALQKNWWVQEWNPPYQACDVTYSPAVHK